MPYVHPELIRLRRNAFDVIVSQAPSSVDGRETGGILLGHDPGEGEIPEVTVAGGPGPRADRRPDGFNRDLEHAQRLADSAFDHDGSVWIGEWHTHPGGPPCPSPKDMTTYTSLLEDDELQFQRLLSLIVTPSPELAWKAPLIWAWVVVARAAVQADLIVLPASDADKPTGSLTPWDYR